LKTTGHTLMQFYADMHRTRFGSVDPIKVDMTLIYVLLCKIDGSAQCASSLRTDGLLSCVMWI